MKTLLIMEDGTVFEGRSIGANHEVICEVVFNTSMTGYLEVITDPAYASQGIVMTYPMIGNYGVNEEDMESTKPWIKAIIVRELCDNGSNFRKQDELKNFLTKNNIVGIEGVDTRAVTRHLRDKGSMRAMITCNTNQDVNHCIEKIKANVEQDLVKTVSPKEKISFEVYIPKIAFIDFGTKQSFIKTFLKKGCEVVVFPNNTPASEIISINPNGIVLSNGPGNPMDCEFLLENIRVLFHSNIPIFAVSLGHQILALATGAKTEKMKHGHRGVNHTVKDLQNGKLYVTDQNHGYTVTKESIPPTLAEISHVNVNDGTVEGIKYKGRDIISVQFQPDSYTCSSGTAFLVDQFVKMMEVKYNAAK